MGGSIGQSVNEAMAARALQYGTPATMPYVQRSAYLADALRQLSESGGKNLRTGGSLASTLLADAITQFASRKADKQLLAREQADQDAYTNSAMAGISDPTQAPPQGAPVPPPVAAASGGPGAAGGAPIGQTPPASPPNAALADALSPRPAAPMPTQADFAPFKTMSREQYIRPEVQAQIGQLVHASATPQALAASPMAPGLVSPQAGAPPGPQAALQVPQAAPQGPSPFANPNPAPSSPPPGAANSGPPSQGGPAFPPTGQGPTPQEYQLLQTYLHSPYPQMRQKGAEMAMAIRQRMATPLEPDKPMWNGQQYVPQPGRGFTPLPGQSPSDSAQRGPDGRVYHEAVPGVQGNVPEGMQLQNGQLVHMPSQQQQTFTIPGATGVFVMGPDGTPKKVADQAVDAKALQGSRDSFRNNDDVKKANEGIAAYNGLASAIAKASGNNGVLDTAAVDSLLRGINPGMGARNTTVNMFLNHLGLPQELESHISGLLGKGYVTPTTLRQMLGIIHSYAGAHVGIAQNLQAQDLGAFKQYGVTADQLGENLTPFAAEPQVKWLDGPDLPGITGAPQVQPDQVNMSDPKAIAAELQAQGYKLVNGKWTK